MYNGHKDWAHWNVSLWIMNTESFYRMAAYFRRDNDTLDQAVDMMHAYLLRQGFKHTPDGAHYTLENLRATLTEISPEDCVHYMTNGA